MKLKVAVINNTDPQFFNAKKGEDKGNDVRLSIPDDSTGFLRSMDFIWKVAKCAGIYVRHDLPGGTGCSSSRWLMCYCLFVLLLHLARCLQMGMTFDGSDTFGVTLFSKIIGSTVLLETFLCTIVLSVVTVHWNHCVSVWKRIQQKALFLAPSSQAIDGYSKLNICCKVFPFAMVTLCLFFGAFLIQEACFSKYSDFLALRSKPLTFPSTEARIWLVISGIETAFCASLHLVYTALVVCLAYALAKEFRLFHERLRDTLRDHTKDTINIEQWRLYHNELCRMVSAVDRIACPYIGAILIASTLILCISFYYVIHSEEDSFGLSVAIFTIIMHEMILFSMAGAGIVVNTQAHIPLEDMYNLDTSEFSGTELTQTHLFLTRLDGSSIGLTAYGFFTINKATVLTAFGTLITYAVVVFQFQSPACSECTQGTLLGNTTALPA